MYDSIPDQNAATATSDIVSELARLSDRTAIPQVVHTGRLEELPLDPPSAFLLESVDGVATIGAVLDSSPLAEDATLYLLAQLVVMKIVRFR